MSLPQLHPTEGSLLSNPPTFPLHSSKQKWHIANFKNLSLIGVSTKHSITYQALTNCICAYMTYLKSLILQIAILDYFLTSMLTNSPFQFLESGFPKYYVFMGVLSPPSEGGLWTSYEEEQMGGDKKFVGGGGRDFGLKKSKSIKEM